MKQTTLSILAALLLLMPVTAKIKVHTIGDSTMADYDESTTDKRGWCTYLGSFFDPQFVEELGVNNFDVCIVAIGDNFQSSLEATCLLKEMGAHYVFARASRDIHKKFLLRNGADEVIYTERETAERFAMRFGSAGIFDYFKLSDDYALYEISVPESWLGKTIIEQNVRQKYNVNVLAIKSGTQFDALPGPDHRFSSDEKLLVLGTKESIKKLLK